MNTTGLLLCCAIFAGGAPAPHPISEAAAPMLSSTAPDEPHGPTGVIVLRNLSLHYSPVSFDHGLHVRMSDFGNGCAACHHDISGLDHTEASVQACRTCHTPTPDATKPVMVGLKGAYHRQCLGCHQDWSHENACGFCHMPVDRVGAAAQMPLGYHGSAEHREAQNTYTYFPRHEPLPVATFHHADHAEKFGLSCVDCHHGASCNDCHGSGSVRYTMDHRMGTCFACHQWDNCMTCHDLTTKPRFDHAHTAGWPLTPAHDRIGCTGCHNPDDRFSAPTSSRCRSCHRVGSGGQFNHTDLGVELLGDHEHIECVMCHRGRLHIGATADCTACHADKHYPENLPGRQR